MSILHPKNGDYVVRGIILQTILSFILCVMWGPVVGKVAREVTDNQEVWAFSLLALGLIIHFFTRNLRHAYVTLAEESYFKKRKRHYEEN